MISSGPGLSPELTVHMVRGGVSVEDILEAAMAFLTDHPSRLSLWDFSGADFSHIQVSRLDPLFNDLLPFVHSRKGGRTALVFASPEGFGLGRMCEALAEVRGFPMGIKAFYSREEARRWLLIKKVADEEDGTGAGVA